MKKTKQEEQEKRDISNYNSGRKEADRKWIGAIDDRIKELEELVGIPELRRLKKQVKYKW